MQKALPYFMLVCLPFWICRCNFPTPLGEDIVQNEVLDVVFIDTINLRLSTVIDDSLITSNSERHLVGFHEDTDIGTVHSRSLLAVRLDSLEIPDEDAEYLYTEFELFYDRYFYYDTAQDFTLKLYPLVEELEYDDDGLLYNISEVDFVEEQVLGELTFGPRPNRAQSISIPVDDAYGQSIFDFSMIDDVDEFFDDFYDFYPGFVLAPDTLVSQCFLGFSLASRLVIHYRLAGEDYEMIFPASGNRFNQILSDRTGTALADLVTSQEDVSSRNTGNKAYLNNAFGLSIKVEIPFLRDIGETLNENFITEATLVLRPVRDTYGDLRPFPAALAFYEVDRFNRIERQLNAPGFLTLDDEFGEDTQYRIEITDFIQEKIDEVELVEDAILVRGASNDLGMNADQLVVGDSFSQFEASLELFILDYIIETD